MIVQIMRSNPAPTAEAGALLQKVKGTVDLVDKELSEDLARESQISAPTSWAEAEVQSWSTFVVHKHMAP